MGTAAFCSYNFPLSSWRRPPSCQARCWSSRATVSSLSVGGIPGLSLTTAVPSKFSPIIRRRNSIFSACPKVSQSDYKVIHGNEEEPTGLGDEANAKAFPSVETLIQRYKTCILNGDEMGAGKLEVAFVQLEKDKNHLSLKFEEMKADITSGKNKLLRLKADFENFRRVSEKDHLTLSSDILVDVVESLLPIVDSFEKAKQQIKPETLKEKNINTSYQGMYKQLVEILRHLRVSMVETVGKPFDPSIHEAVARVESLKFKENIVAQELRRGFFLGNRLLRPAMVKVSRGPGNPIAISDVVEQPGAAEACAALKPKQSA